MWKRLQLQSRRRLNGPVAVSACQRCLLSTDGGTRQQQQQGYQSIGSFHSDNLQDLMQASNEVYKPPDLPFPGFVQEENDDGSFMLDLENWTFLNHGAFGAALHVGYQRAAQWRRYLEEQPLRYFDRALLPHLAYSTRRLADFIGLENRSNITLLQNATYGLNTVIGGYCRKYGSSANIVVWDTSYGSVKSMARHYCGNSVAEVPLQERYLDRLASGGNASNDELEAVLQDALNQSLVDAKCKHPLVILDQITSNTALTFPVEKLARQVKDWDSEAVVLVDGAHGLLAQPAVDFQTTSAIDFYISNCHKWLSAPRGAAMMVTNDYDRWKDSILRRPAVMSHGVDAPDFLSRFLWDGCRDYAAELALPVVLDHWEKQGPDEVRRRIRAQLEEGVQVLANKWHPHCANDKNEWPGQVTLAPTDSALLSSPLVLVRLPDTIVGATAKRLQDYFYANQIEVPVKNINGKLHVRVSCHVYNQTQHFEKLAVTMLQYRK